MAKSNHKGPHKYKRQTLKKSGTAIFSCMISGCPHWLYENFIVGKLCTCYRCGDVFEITKKISFLKRLHCDSCTRSSKKKEENKEVDSLMESVESLLGISELGNLMKTKVKEGENDEKIEAQDTLPIQSNIH